MRIAHDGKPVINELVVVERRQDDASKSASVRDNSKCREEAALPTHVSIAYAILRHNGVDIGKRDFRGPINSREGEELQLSNVRFWPKADVRPVVLRGGQSSA